MEVSENVKNAYMGTGKTKYITLEFPELGKTIMTGDGRIHSDSLHLSESISNSNSIEFVGCIASQFKITVSDIEEEIEGKKIVVKIHTDGTEDEPIPLFKGIVDSAEGQSNTRAKDIIAYDELYKKGSTKVAAWYKSLKFDITLKDLRDSLFDYIGLEQVKMDLPNDNVTIKKQYNPNVLQALVVIKAICQINGVFGIVNREGKFEYRIVGNIEKKEGLYPPFYPSPNTFPGVSLSALGLDNIKLSEIPFYKNVEFENYKVKPVDKITIRQSEDNEGVSYGNGTNNYIIQGNMFTYGLSKDVLLQVAANIYPNIQGFSYRPFTSINNGLPFLECGLDAVSYMMLNFKKTKETGEMVYDKHDFYILNRELTGIQALKDSYSAQGEKDQKEFITDLQTQIDTLKKSIKQEVEEKVEDYTYPKEEINKFLEDMLKAVSVMEVPPPEEQVRNTIYFIWEDE